MPQWISVARADEVQPGTALAVRAGDAELALVRVGDDFYATQGACIHLHGPLGDGWVDGCLLTCPWHGWQYDVRTGENAFDRAIALQTYEVRVEDGEVRVAV